MLALMVAGALVLLATAALLVTSTRPTSVVSFLLGIYLVAWAELITLVLVLSALRSLARIELSVGLLASLVAAGTLWAARGRCRPPSPQPALRTLRDSFRDPALLLLAGTTALVGAYALVLGVSTPQNEWDALSYHLTRAAYWIQQGFVSYVPGAFDDRVNVNPPNAEIGQLATMLLGSDDRFVWLPQFGAIPATMLAVYGIGRRAGIEPRGAVFGALVFACLPLILLQASTAMNDLVVASFLSVATYFALGTGRRSAAAAALALGLGLGTKFSAPLLLPVYLLVVLVARRRRLLEHAAIVLLGIALGAVWYLLNLLHTGALEGGLTADAGQVPDRAPLPVLTRSFQLLLDALELPGAAPPRNMYLYAACATVTAAVAGMAFLRRRPSWFGLLVAAALIVATPLLVSTGGRGATWAWRSGWDALGREDVANRVAPFELPTLSDSSTTWFGPVGALLTVVGLVLAARSVRDGRALRVSLAAAPLLFVPILATAIVYDPWRGRFFVFPMALAAASWGIVRRSRPLTWAVTGVTITTSILVLANSFTKPPGIRLLAPATSPSVFGEPRWRVQTWTRIYDNTNEVVRFVEEHVPASASIGLRLRPDDFAYPYFGAGRRRTVDLLSTGAPVPGDVAWIVVAPGKDVPRCEADWQTSFETESGFRVLQRTGRTACT